MAGVAFSVPSSAVPRAVYGILKLIPAPFRDVGNQTAAALSWFNVAVDPEDVCCPPLYLAASAARYVPL